MSAVLQELRTDVLTGRRVILAAGRNQRPVVTTSRAKTAVEFPEEYDPFLEGNEHDTPDERLALRKDGSLANQRDWLLRIVPNRYPAVADLAATEMSGTRGVHDVVIECPDSRHRLSDLKLEELARVFYAWQTRVRQITSDYRIQATSVFRNEGSGAGASLPHCHSQILATEFISNQLQQRLQTVKNFLPSPKLVHTSLFECWLKSELDAEVRIVKATGTFVTVCPYASRVDWHTRFVPDRAARDFRKLSTFQIVELAGHVLGIARSLRDLVGNVDQNLALILPPNDRPEAFPWMLDFLPRKNRFAGFEILTDTDILTLPPETAASQLRQHNTEVTTIDSKLALQPAGYIWSDGQSAFSEPL